MERRAIDPMQLQLLHQAARARMLSGSYELMFADWQVALRKGGRAD